MTSNPVDETRVADPVERKKRQRHSDARKRPKKRGRRNSNAAGRLPQAVTTIPNLQTANRSNSRLASTCSVAEAETFLGDKTGKICW
jgi:hypothetical protein